MDVEKVLCMVGGSSETSYAANSKTQEKAILTIRPMLEKAVGEIYRNLLPEKMVVADLGCSSGPNTFVVLSKVIKIISSECLRAGHYPPEMQFFLNDLPSNDFNNIFQSLDLVFQSVKAEKDTISVPHFVAGLPGTFCGRLFPRQSVHFFNSSFSLMWMSQDDFSTEYTRRKQNEGAVPLVPSPLSLPPPTPETPTPSISDSEYTGDMIPLSTPPTPLSIRRTSRSNAGVPPDRYGFPHDIAQFVSYSNISPVHGAFITSLDIVSIPKCWQIAKEDPKWKAAMLEELGALDKNKTLISGLLELGHVATKEQVTDCLTKGLSSLDLSRLCDKMGLVNIFCSS